MKQTTPLITRSTPKNKFFLIIYFALIFLFSFTSSLYGQTKKTTIKWINANGTSLSQIQKNTPNQGDPLLYFSILEVDNDSIYYINNYKNLTSEVKHSILLKDILYEDVKTLERRNNLYGYNIANFVIKVRSISKDKNRRNKKIETIRDFQFPFEDEDKAIRVVTAIMNLARLKGAEENKQYF